MVGLCFAPVAGCLSVGARATRATPVEAGAADSVITAFAMCAASCGLAVVLGLLS